jgi:hypothetical protein
MHFNTKSKGDSHARTAFAERKGDYFTGRALDREFRSALNAAKARGDKRLPELPPLRPRNANVTRAVQVAHQWSVIAKPGLLSRIYGANGTRGRDGKFVPLGAVLHANGMLAA